MFSFHLCPWYWNSKEPVGWDRQFILSGLVINKVYTTLPFIWQNYHTLEIPVKLVGGCVCVSGFLEVNPNMSCERQLALHHLLFEDGKEKKFED